MCAMTSSRGTHPRGPRVPSWLHQARWKPDGGYSPAPAFLAGFWRNRDASSSRSAWRACPITATAWRESEQGQHASVEPGHREDSASGGGEYHHPVCVSDLLLGGPQVHAERGMAVGPCGDQPEDDIRAEHEHLEEPGHRLTSSVLEWDRRHGQPHVVGEQRDQAIHVCCLVRPREPVDELTLGRGSRRRGRFSLT